MGKRGSESLERRPAKTSQHCAGALVLWLAMLAPLPWITGCTGMVNAQDSSQSAVQVVPAAVDFGSTGIGKQVSHAATVSNTGKTTVTLTEADVSSTQFSVSGLQFPVSLQAGQKANFTVWFKSSKAGKSNGTINLHRDKGAPVPVTLTGTSGSSSPQLSTSPTHDFGNVTLNTVATGALTLTNSGASNLTVSSISVTGAGFAAGRLKLPAKISAGGNVILDITFSPKTAGNYSGSVSIASDDPDNPTTTVNLTGVATTVPVGTLTATPATLSFGNVQVESSASAVTTVRNTGTANVTLSQINLSTAGFSTTGIATPVLIVPGESLALTVKFSPSAVQPRSGTISLITSQGGITSVSVSGTAVQSAGLTVSPGSINFGNVVTGVTNTQTVQIGNPSASSVVVNAANITGTGFTASGLSLPMTLSAGQTSTFNVQFNPKTAVPSSGTLSFVSNASSAPSIALTGAGVAAGLTLSANPASVAFGNVTVGSSASRSVTITNTGNSNVAISSVTLVGSNLVLTGGSAVSLSPSQSIALTLQFTPTAAAPTAGTVSIVSNATGSPAAIPISGTGVTQVQHKVMLSWNTSTSASGYNVYRSVTSGTGYSRLNPTLDASLTYTDSAVQNSQTYFYVTTAVDSAGEESAFSSEVSVSIP
jgi:Abnormal spindle-like microcephaly-assoc'd, ASPM-SPD-2-Hydin